MSSLQTYLLVNRRNRRQARHRQSLRQRTGRAGMGAGSLLVLAGIAVLLALGGLYAGLTYDLPSTATLPALLNPLDGLSLQPTRLYDRSGEHLLLTLENPGAARRYLPLDPTISGHLSPQLIQATVELLEPDFWQHPGFAYWDLANPQPLTIAERLADDLLLEQEAPGLRRTLRMRLLAAQLVAEYGRSRVLEWYLNGAYFGHLAYGAESAAQLYLGKSATDLNLEESTLLVMVAGAPAINPLDSPQGSLERQQEALGRLLAAGVIQADQYERALAAPLNVQSAPAQAETVAGAFTNLVVQELSQRYGRRQVERGGMRVITTLDYDLQLELACTLRTQLNRMLDQPAGDLSDCPAARLLPTLPPGGADYPPDLAASAALIDTHTGQVLAYLGDTRLDGETWSASSHQPGSTLTPFVALAGFTRGMSPATLVWDIPAAAGDVSTNPDGRFHGPQRLRLAATNDYLVGLADLIDQIGATNVWRMAETLGLHVSAPDSDPAELLYGGGQVTLLELAQAYSVFANHGSLAGQRLRPDDPLVQPSGVLAVQDPSGSLRQETPPAETQTVLSEPLAYLVHDLLSDETARWPSLGYPNALEIGQPAAAKAGQAGDGRQVWAVGYSAGRLGVVWMGLPDDSPSRLEARPAAGIWHALLQYSTRGLAADDWSVPAGITHLDVCDPSGKLPTVDCPTLVNELFLNGNEPVEYDDLYRSVEVNRETGRLATVFTPLELVEQKTFLVVPPQAQAWAAQAGLEQPPTTYDAIQAPPVLPGVQVSSPPMFAYVHGMVELRGTASGEDFVSYRLQVGQGLNPRDWLQVGSESQTPVEDGPLGLWDTRELNGLYALRLTVLRQDQRLETAILQVTVDNTPPVVRVTYPAPGGQFAYPAERSIQFLAEAQDEIGVAGVEWYVDGRRIGETQLAPFTFPWEGTPGEHTLTVKAYDLAGNPAESPAVEFTLER
ncbi:MAG: transglycosylase domain-containing protein [Anaerolineaceae bacterium]|nr:transglycosylase domain-containing protein [Anaerolineaceae bacterium]